MAHEIYLNRAMAYVGETPWHKLGVKLPALADWASIRDAVGFYTVQERPLYAPGCSEPLPDVKALFASDDGRYLSTVGGDYGVVDFNQAAEAIVRACGEANSGAVFECGGLLGQRGAKAFLLGKLPKPIEVVGDKSPIEPYFAAVMGHDGRTAINLINCATRIVCANTVAAALAERGVWRTTIQHRSGAESRVKAAGTAFRALVTGYEKFGQLADALAMTSFGVDRVEQATKTVFPIAASDTERTAENQQERRRQVLALAMGAMDKGQPACELGTAWAAFNAFAEFADHHKFVERKALAASNRLESVWFGSAAELKFHAFAVISKLAA